MRHVGGDFTGLGARRIEGGDGVRMVVVVSSAADGAHGEGASSIGGFERASSDGGGAESSAEHGDFRVVDGEDCDADVAEEDEHAVTVTTTISVTRLSHSPRYFPMQMRRKCGPTPADKRGSPADSRGSAT